jgi:hypothetical protein
LVPVRRSSSIIQTGSFKIPFFISKQGDQKIGKQIGQIVVKSSQNSQKGQIIHIKLQIESPKQLFKITYEALRYLQ